MRNQGKLAKRRALALWGWGLGLVVAAGCSNKEEAQVSDAPASANEPAAPGVGQGERGHATATATVSAAPTSIEERAEDDGDATVAPSSTSTNFTFRGPTGGVKAPPPPTDVPESAPDPLSHGGKGKKVMQSFASDVGGKLDSEEVSRTIDASVRRFQTCANEDVVLRVRLKVLPSGSVGDARVTSSTPDDPKLRDCATAVMRTLMFPKPRGNEPASLTLELAFKRRGVG